MSTSVQIGLRSASPILPLISSSLTLFYAIAEFTIFVPFVRCSETEPKATNRIVYLWWNAFFWSSLASIMSILLPTIVCGSYALQTLESGTLQWKLYATGTAFAVGHLAFAPWIVPEINAMCDEEEEKKGRTVSHLRTWLNVHLWRTILTDVPAFACFAWGFFGL